MPRVLETLRAKGLRPEQVDYVILTHVHLDHAGGAGLLLSKLGNAKLTVHPRGARHVVDPQKLIEGTVAVYGETAMRRTYGEIMPVPRARIVETPHQSTLKLNGRELVFFDTPGHARHHVCVLDSRSGHLFAGDTFGLSYRELDCDGHQYVFPTSSPVQFDPGAEHRSLDLILSLKPCAIYIRTSARCEISPYGRRYASPGRGARAACSPRAGAGPARHERLRTGVEQLVLDEARRYGWRLSSVQILEIFAGDIELNAQGLGAWLDAEQKPAMRS